MTAHIHIFLFFYFCLSSELFYLSSTFFVCFRPPHHVVFTMRLVTTSHHAQYPQRVGAALASWNYRLNVVVVNSGRHTTLRPWIFDAAITIKQKKSILKFFKFPPLNAHFPALFQMGVCSRGLRIVFHDWLRIFFFFLVIRLNRRLAVPLNHECQWIRNEFSLFDRG